MIRRTRNLRRERIQRMILALSLMASTGISSVQELGGALANQLGLPERSYAARRVFWKYLTEAGLVHYQVLPYFRRGLAVVQLSPGGVELCQAAGWEVVESEWDRLLGLHDAEHAPAHAAMILAFAREARRRGWAVQVMPDVDSLPVDAAPDVLVEQYDLRWYVEVERSRAFKPEKWRNQVALQGATAFCVRTANRREKLATELNQLKISGVGTDLESLQQSDCQPGLDSLWIQNW